MSDNPYASQQHTHTVSTPRWVETVFYLRTTSALFCLSLIGLKLFTPAFTLSSLATTTPVIVLFLCWLVLAVALRPGIASMRYLSAVICSFLLGALLLSASYNVMEQADSNPLVLHQILVFSCVILGYGSALVALMNSHATLLFFTYPSQPPEQQEQELVWLALNTPPYPVMLFRLMLCTQWVVGLHMLFWLVERPMHGVMYLIMALLILNIAIAPMLLGSLRRHRAQSVPWGQRYAGAAVIFWGACAGYCVTQQYTVLTIITLLVGVAWFVVRGAINSLNCRAWFVPR